MAQADPGPAIDQEVCHGIAEGGCIPPEPDSPPPNLKVGEKIPAPRPKLEAGEKLRRRLPELKMGEKTPAPRPRIQAEPLRERP